MKRFTNKSILNKFAKKEKDSLQQSTLMAKSLRKAFMIRSKLKNKYEKDRSSENFCEYKHQRSVYINFKQTKIKYFNNLM